MLHVASIIKHPGPLAKSKMLLGSAAFLLGIAMLTPEAMAGHKMMFGPQGFESQYHTVASIQTHGRDDEIVVLRGRLTNYLYKDSYEFTDESGATIEVELDDDVDWSYVHKDQLIEIMGEVERNMFKIKIEAKNYRILETSAVARANEMTEAQTSNQDAVLSEIAAQAASPLEANALDANTLDASSIDASALGTNSLDTNAIEANHSATSPLEAEASHSETSHSEANLATPISNAPGGQQDLAVDVANLQDKAQVPAPLSEAQDEIELNKTDAQH